MRTIDCDPDWGQPALLSPDGKTYIAVAQSSPGSYHYKARLFRLPGNVAIAHLVGGSLLIEADKLAYAPDGKKLRLCGIPKPGDEAGLWLWDIEAGKGTKLLPDRKGHRFHLPHHVTFSPDGKLLAFIESLSAFRGIWVIDAITGKEVVNIKKIGSNPDPNSDTAVNCIRFSPDGKTIATADYERMVKLWDMGTGKELSRMEHLDTVKSVAFHPGGALLASFAADRKVRLWDIKRQRVVFTTDSLDRLSSLFDRSRTQLEFSPDGKQLALIRYPSFFPVYRANITIWDVTGELPRP